MALRPLTLLETRVLGVLVEKQHTVPDSYPLSLNALTLGCNQKTARDPVLNAGESEVLLALDALKGLSLVFEVSGSRVTRYEHNLGRVLGVPGQSVAILAMLMLRGPQTAAELRAHTERLHRFADVSSVEAFLDELAAHDPPWVGQLPRAPGARESRWMHRLGEPTAFEAAAGAMQGAGPAGPAWVAHGAASAGGRPAEWQALRDEQDALRLELQSLQQQVARLYQELGLPPPGSGPPPAPDA